MAKDKKEIDVMLQIVKALIVFMIIQQTNVSKFFEKYIFIIIKRAGWDTYVTSSKL